MSIGERTSNMAVFCDYENLALGAKDADYELRIGDLLARLLDKGNIIVKRAYADWARYASARRPLHEAGFELVEIPHTRYAGKNSADIRLVVDALELCHAKAYVDTFCIISGDSDFSPLVSKLRENARFVIGMGVKSSTSDLLVESCDEFVFYDDLVRKRRGEGRDASRAQEALDLLVDTADRLLSDRGDGFHGSLLKQALKRKRPHFSESYHGFRNFNELLEEAARRRLLQLREDPPSGGYVIRALGEAA